MLEADCVVEEPHAEIISAAAAAAATAAASTRLSTLRAPPYKYISDKVQIGRQIVMLLAIESSPKVDAYDVVVIGAGIGGLSAAAVLAKQGQRVLVLEQGNAAGGYAHAFQHGPYTLDPAVHVFSQGHDHALPAALLSWLGVREQVRMIPFAQNYSAVYPDMMVNAPFGFDAYVETHQHSLDGAFYTAQSVLSALGAPEIGLEHPDLPPSA